MKLAIMVHSHDGPMVFGDIPGCFFKYWFSWTDSIRENDVQYNGCALLLLGLKCLFELSFVFVSGVVLKQFPILLA